MSANAGTITPSGQKKLARGKKRSDAAPGHASQNMPSPERAKEGENVSAEWIWKSLAEIAADGAPILYGILQPGPNTSGGVPYVRPTEIVEDVIDLSSVRRTTPLIAGKYKRSILKPDDIILSIVGTIGKVALVPPDLDGANITQSSVRIRPRSDVVLPRYVAWALRSRVLRRQFDKHRLGTAVPRLNVAHVRALRLPVPSLPEQRQIVAEIEKQFTRLEAAVAALRRVQANLKRYRAAVLKAACEGRLVPTEAELAKAENRKFETGEQLLARLLTKRRKSWQGRGKYKEPPASDTANLQPLPEGWKWASVEQLLREPLCNGVSVKGSDNPPGVRALRLSAMSNSGFDYSDARYLPLHDSDVDDLWIQEGDFFMSRGNGSLHLVGRGTPAQKPPNPTIFPDTMIRLRLTDTVRKSGWLRTLWPSRIIRSQVETRVKTTAGIYKIAQPQVEGMVIPLPPRAEQTRIVAEVERRMSVVEELETAALANLLRARGLRQSILQRAFRG